MMVKPIATARPWLPIAANGGGAPQNPPLEEVGQGRLAYPAQGERRHRDSKLRGGDVAAKGLEGLEGQPSFAVTGLGHGFEPGFAGADQGKFGGDKEGVPEDQGDDDRQRNGDRQAVRCGGHGGKVSPKGSGSAVRRTNLGGG